MAQAVLTALVKINELGIDLNSDDRVIRESAVRSLYRTLGALEVIAERRVDASDYEAYRRSMEVCHIAIPEQATHG
jgi:hypothetical protein